MRDIDLLVVGDCNPDLVLSGGQVRPVFGQGERMVDRADLVIGGTSSITACGAAKLGLATTFVGVLGADDFGDFMRAQMLAEGVDMSQAVVDPITPTGLSVVLTDGEDRATLTARGTIGAVTAAMVSDELLRRCRHVHTAGYFLQGAAEVVAELFSRARATGATTSLDPGADPDERWQSGLASLYPLIDQLLPNAVEACGLAGTDDVVEAARRLAREVPAVVVKLGAEGVLAVTGGELARGPAVAVDVVDTIGAGDSTNAGWLAARLGGRSLAQSARLAAVCGSLSTQARGGTASQPTLAQAEAAL
jgi:sugar/nucleoside kinase (ribokinase family)